MKCFAPSWFFSCFYFNTLSCFDFISIVKDILSSLQKYYLGTGYHSERWDHMPSCHTSHLEKIAPHWGQTLRPASIQTRGAAKKEPWLTQFRLYMAAAQPATVTLHGNTAGVEMVLIIVSTLSTTHAEFSFSCSLGSNSLGVFTGNLVTNHLKLGMTPGFGSCLFQLELACAMWSWESFQLQPW